MFFNNFCPPALIYFIFMLVHVVVALYNKEGKGAILQLIIGLLVTLLLQMLCLKGMSLISWIIVFVPFIFYTYMMIILYFVFGIQPNTNMQKYLVN